MQQSVPSSDVHPAFREIDNPENSTLLSWRVPKDRRLYRSHDWQEWRCVKSQEHWLQVLSGTSAPLHEKSARLTQSPVARSLRAKILAAQLSTSLKRRQELTHAPIPYPTTSALTQGLSFPPPSTVLFSAESHANLALKIFILIEYTLIVLNRILIASPAYHD
ncbi:hypothetical protein AAMO2058_000045700 [Amorphochlora amoebiformis]